MDELISEKIEELIELAKIADDKNVQIVLLALSGARAAGDDGLLGEEVQRFIREVLIPNVQIKKALL